MKPEAVFLNNLAESVRSVHRVAMWLQDKGFDVRMLPIMVRPDAAQRLVYGDKGDLEVRMVVEVKKRELDFSCAADFPFETVIVDEAYKVDRNRQRVYAYAILNATETAVCLVPYHSRRRWQMVTRYDSKEGQERTFYEAPKEHCAFFALGS